MRSLTKGMTPRRLWLTIVLLGGALFTSGAGMRGYAQVVMADTERRLLAARPASPETLPTASTSLTIRHDSLAASAAPTFIRIPALDLWNALQPVGLDSGANTEIWQTSDAGWHNTSAYPGQGGNIVIAGHSPSADPAVWPHSVFRQLAYLTPGERIELVAGSQIHRYSISRVFAIPARETNNPAATAWLTRGTTERLTLITCWPPHTAAYRVIVVAEPDID